MPLALEHLRTADGVVLDGLGYDPEPLRAGSPAWDGVLLIHGAGSRCTAPGLLEDFALRAVADGARVLRLDTRGHDLVTFLTGGRWGGAAHERIEECPLDLAAGHARLVELGCRRIAWVGHSLGGVKVLFAAAAGAPPELCGTAAIAPPRFVHAALSNHPDGPAFRDEWSRASDLVELGSGNMLLETTQPARGLLTAAGFLEKYGPADRFDFVPLLPRLTVPTCVLLPELAVARSAASWTTPAALTEIAPTAPHLTWEILPGTDVGCGGRFEEVYLAVRRGLRVDP